VGVAVPSALGGFLVEGDQQAVTRVVLPGQRGSAALLPAGEVPACLQDAARQLTEFLAGERADFDVFVRSCGTAFQELVWARLASIGYGETITYAELAAAVGHPAAARAVGQAVGANPLPVLVPCHRVVGSDGKLGGYAGGRDLKSSLLGLEADRRLTSSAAGGRS
jgi:methylated-DNA-[protein]-cysteine S-methyltransferase